MSEDGLATGTDLVAAAGSAVGQALERLGGCRPDLLCVFVCGGNPETILYRPSITGRVSA